MASIKKRPDGRWRARYRDQAGKEYSKHFVRRVDAQSWLDEVTASVVTGQYVDPKAGRITVETMAQAWMASHPRWSETTRERYRSILANHIVPRWGRTRLSNITFEDVQAWVVELEKNPGLAAGSIRKIEGVLSSILKLAVQHKRLAGNPADGVELPKQPLSRRRYLSARQVENIAEESDGNDDIVFVLAYTGLRFGEFAALRAHAIDPVRRRLRVEAAVTEVNGHLVWSSPKDHERRSVPYPPFLDDAMAGRLDGLGSDDLVFGSTQGHVLRLRNMRRDWFNTAVARAGVPGLTPHELRHTAASMAVAAGASVLALQRMLGHEKASMTLDTYSDLFDEDLDALGHALTTARSKALKDR